MKEMPCRCEGKADWGATQEHKWETEHWKQRKRQHKNTEMTGPRESVALTATYLKQFDTKRFTDLIDIPFLFLRERERKWICTLYRSLGMRNNIWEMIR